MFLYKDVFKEIKLLKIENRSRIDTIRERAAGSGQIWVFWLLDLGPTPPHRWHTVPVCLSLTDFLECATFSVKTVKFTGKQGKLVSLSPCCLSSDTYCHHCDFQPGNHWLSQPVSEIAKWPILLSRWKRNNNDNCVTKILIMILIKTFAITMSIIVK